MKRRSCLFTLVPCENYFYIFRPIIFPDVIHERDYFVRRLNEVLTLPFDDVQCDYIVVIQSCICLLYTSDAADERSSVDLGGRRILKKKKQLQAAEAR